MREAGGIPPQECCKGEFFQVVARRRSVRVFQEKDVEPCKMHRLLRAAIRAPSAGNLQAYQIYWVTRRDVRKALATAAAYQEFVAQAPVNLVFCAAPQRSAWRYGARGKQLYCLQDATIACAYAQLAVTALGLGSCWVGAFDEKAVVEVLGCPQELRPVAILAIGYPNEKPKATPRRRLEGVVFRL